MGEILLECLQEQFTVPNPDLPTPGQFCMIAGEEITEDIDPIVGTDLCCEGLGWVRIGNTVPSSNFPNPDPVLKSCLPTGWAQEYDIGLLGCYNPGATPEMATCAEHNVQAMRDYERIMALKGVACCFQERLRQDPKTRGRLWNVVGLRVEGPRSNCISRVMSITVNIGKCC